ncbi:MAG: bifunctional serine/threonine-protein kinase/formylglycine-generating enzyme family protein [Candidatus Solibacter sp.]|nr:bifunctional serine/threonine-protein kinase/formylglycine-generating enzyme family protein [Candidatus Solibacter sp.]
MIQLPARIGKYELQEFLGGGMSHVYRAVDTVIGRPVAVKILTQTASQDEEAKARFLTEARTAGNLTHENVISIYDFGCDEEHGLYMVMEFLQGEDLRGAIRNGHTGDLSKKLRIAIQVARALEYVHKARIIHRDIKPENVHINAAGVVKLMDFGIAKTEDLSMTRAGYVLGTPYYMAPEQVRGEKINDLVDVYAFGILLFELLAGQKPISGDTVERIFYSILNEPLDLAPLVAAGTPQPVVDLVAACTAKKPADRPQNFGLVAAALEKARDGLDAPTQALTQVSPPAASAPPARPAWLIPGIAVLCVLAAVGLYFALRPLPKVIATSTGAMVLVPAGEFASGGDKQRISLPAFYIDRTEVPNAEYAKFCRATNRPLPERFSADRPDYPVVNVTIEEARSFAAWAGKRLPKPLEWEKAARGTDGRAYPWGNQQDPTRANVDTHQLRPVDGYPAGASPFGALQMVGNVWEFVDQLRAPSPEALQSFSKLKPPPRADEPWYMIRGQSCGEPLLDAVIWESAPVPARWKDIYIGFRCVKSVP